MVRASVIPLLKFAPQLRCLAQHNPAAVAVRGWIEAKTMDAWIFGSEKIPQWTQGIFGKQFRFQNPLHPNYRHTKALADLLLVSNDGVDAHSLVQ